MSYATGICSLFTFKYQVVNNFNYEVYSICFFVINELSFLLLDDILRIKRKEVI